MTEAVANRTARPKKDGSRGPGVVEISDKSALSAMQKATGDRTSFAAAQTLWARHAHDKLDHRIVRGAPRLITGREHLTVQQYRELVERHDEHERRRGGSLQTMTTVAAAWLEADATQKRKAATANETDLHRRREAFVHMQERSEEHALERPKLRPAGVLLAQVVRSVARRVSDAMEPMRADTNLRGS